MIKNIIQRKNYKTWKVNVNNMESEASSFDFLNKQRLRWLVWKKDYWIIQFISHFLSPPLPLDPSLSKPELPPGLERKMAPCCSLELPPDLDGEAGPPKILTIIRASCPWAFRVGAPPVSAAWWWCCCGRCCWRPGWWARTCESSLMKMLLQ